MLYNPQRHKYLIIDKEAFTKTELPLYEVIRDLVERDEIVDVATVHYEMSLKQLTDEYKLIVHLAKKNNYDADNISVYHNLILQQFRLDLFRNAKNDAEIHKAITKMEELQELTDSKFYSASDGLNNLINQKGVECLRTGLKLFDEKIYFSNGITLIAGKQGSGKTSILVELMKRILVIDKMANKEPTISVQWNTMEDEINMIVASMVSKDIQIPAKEIYQSPKKLKNHKKFNDLKNAFDKFDIEFQDKQLSIQEIKTNWKVFLKQRKKMGAKKVLLIIDNVMQLTDHGGKGNQTEKDDFICSQISLCRNEAKKVFGNNYHIIVLHHLGKEQMNRTNSKSCYKPVASDIKGSGRYLDLPTLTLFIHRFDDFKDIINDFKKYEEFIEHITMVICTKNRTGGWIGDGYLWADMEYKYCCNFPEPE